MKLDFEKIMLDNGLRGILLQDESYPVASINLLCDITKCRTMQGNPAGIYRFVVQLLKNTIEPSSGRPYSQLIDQIALESNVMATHDYIMLSQTLTSADFEYALSLESQRLLHLFETMEPEFVARELNAIEIVGRLPGFVDYKRALHNALFPEGHPYHEPAIDHIKAELRSLPIERLQDLCKRTLAPETASICIVGNVREKRVEKLMEKHFSKLPKYSSTENVLATCQKSTDAIAVRTNIVRFASPGPNPALCLGWRLASRLGRSDDLIINICAALLANRAQGYLYKRLVESHVAVAVGCYYEPLKLGSKFTLEIMLGNNEYSIDKVASMVEQELENISRDPLSELILSTAVNEAKLQILQSYDSTMGLARQLNLHSFWESDASHYISELQRWENIRENVLRNFVFEHINFNTAVRLEALPDKANADERSPDREEARTEIGSGSSTGLVGTGRGTSRCPARIGPLSLPPVNTFTRANKLRVYHLKRPHAPFVILSLLNRASLDEDPIQLRGISAFLNHYMIDSKRELEKLKRQLELSTIRIDHTNIKDGTNLTLSMVRENMSLAFDFLAELIRAPKFDANLIDRQKSFFIKSLRDNVRLPVFAAFNILQRAIFGPKHPYGYWNYGRPETVALITQDNLRAFHDSYYTPDNTALVVVGDIERDDILRLTDEFFGDWRGVSKPESLCTKTSPDEAQRFVFDMPELPVTTLLIGQNFHANQSTRHEPKIIVLSHLIEHTLNSLLEESLRPGNRSQCNIGLRKQTGLLSLKMTALDSSVVGHVEDKITKHLIGLTTSLVSLANLETAKHNAVREVISCYLSSWGAAKTISQLFVYDLPENHDHNVLEEIQAVSCNDMLELSNKFIMPTDLKSVLVGPAEHFRLQLVEKQTRYLSAGNYDDFFIN